MEKQVKPVKKEKQVKKVEHDSTTKVVLRFICGVLFALFALFTLVSLISYLFTWRGDQSLLFESDLFRNLTGVENGGGRIGFIWSNFLISKTFGLGAFIIPFFLGGVSVFCFKIKNVRIVRLFFMSLLGCIVLSMLFSYIFSFTSFNSLFGQGAGGSYGYYINEWLCAMLGKIGAGCVVSFLLITWLILLSRKVIDKFYALFDKMFKKKGESDSVEAGIEEESEESVEEEVSEEKETPKVEEVEFEIKEWEQPDVEPISEPEPVQEEEEEEELEGEIELEPPYPYKREEIDPDHEFEVFDQKEESDEELSDADWRQKYDPRLSLSRYKFPPITLLEEYKAQKFNVSREELEKNNRKISETLQDFKIAISKISARVGPTVTLYEVVPAPGVRVSSIKKLEEDIARSLAAKGVRVVTLEGSNAVGIEVANEKPSIVSMRSLLEDPKFQESKFDLPVALGKTIANSVMIHDLAKMPHLLIAGATGQGKSVGLNAIITSLLFKKHPAELKLVLVDPKKVELSLYEPIVKHYLAKLPDEEDAIITDTQKVVYTLRSLCKLMDTRYDLLKAAGVRNIKEYNEKFLSRKLNPNKGHQYMPFIVVIIDEFADLLMTAGREIEDPMARLAQLARAIGIHLVIATQRPTTNIITGTIKANFTARIAFRVISSVDSKTILDQSGANQLVGRGDMLVSAGSAELIRVQCAFIDTPEVESIAEYISGQQSYGRAFDLPEYIPEDKGASGGSSGAVVNGGGGGRDELFEEAARLVVREQSGSTSLLQRRFRIGHNRAGSIMDQLYEVGIVGPSVGGGKPRDVNYTSFDSLEQLLSTLG